MFIITGMHRSGTSLIARLFYELGADMGDPGTFYRPDRWNPEGYYEQPEIHDVNMPLINGPWWKFAYFRLPSTQTICQRARKRTAQIQATAAQYQGKVVKETRFCLTLPAWLEQGAQVDKILICLRDPIQVARSLQKRNRALLRHGYYLWREHNERILSHAGEIPVWLVDYTNVMNPESYALEVAAALRFFGYNAGEAELSRLREQCVRADIFHHREITADYPARIAQLWNDLRKRHAAQFE